jgi:hypothetical protein
VDEFEMADLAVDLQLRLENAEHRLVLALSDCECDKRSGE